MFVRGSFPLIEFAIGKVGTGNGISGLISSVCDVVYKSKAILLFGEGHWPLFC